MLSNGYKNDDVKNDKNKSHPCILNWQDLNHNYDGLSIATGLDL